jgi:hypothetical protein
VGVRQSGRTVARFHHEAAAIAELVAASGAVARAAGTTSPSVYLRFAGKVDLVFASPHAAAHWSSSTCVISRKSWRPVLTC